MKPWLVPATELPQKHLVSGDVNKVKCQVGGLEKVPELEKVPSLLNTSISKGNRGEPWSSTTRTLPRGGREEIQTRKEET